MGFTNILRKNIGTIIACLGFVLLCIVTFGDLGEIHSKAYWANVRNNMLGISLVSIGLTFIQVSIRQGVAEQALRKGLNAENTTQKYQEHKVIIEKTNDKQVYLPYFLRVYNKKHTKLRKQEYLINNNYCSAQSLYANGTKKLIKGYERICVNVTAASIKWSTVDVVYDKNGRIETLNEHRRRRIIKGILSSLASMIGTTFITGGLFFTSSAESLGQKFIKLFTYCISIAISAIFAVVKEYEKGAFGVPNELDEINQIWHEFELWEVPDWVKHDVEMLNKDEEVEIDEQETHERTADLGADIQAEQEASEDIYRLESGCLVPVSFLGEPICLSGPEEQSGKRGRDIIFIGQGELHCDPTGTEL